LRGRGREQEGLEPSDGDGGGGNAAFDSKDRQGHGDGPRRRMRAFAWQPLKPSTIREGVPGVGVAWTVFDLRVEQSYACLKD
jgi:hypothetical protein